MERTSASRGAESGVRREEGKYSSNPSRREGSRESAGRVVVAIAIAIVGVSLRRSGVL